MRLVDLLLSPRQPSYGGGVSAKESPYRHSYNTAYNKSKNSSEVKPNQTSKRSPRCYQTQETSSPNHQSKAEKSSRSSGALSDLLLSKKSSSTSLGYWNQSPVTPNSSSVTSEISRLAQQPGSPCMPMVHGYVKQECDDASTGGFGAKSFDICLDGRQPFITMDKTLNGNIWRREEFSLKSSFSSSSSPSSSSQSSSGVEDLAFGRRRVSLLSSDGSEIEPEHILPFMADSDGYESLSSPLESMDSVRWMGEQVSADTTGYLDWSNADGDGERNGYDIGSSPLFNFNFFDNALDDSPFESFDDRDIAPKYSNSYFPDNNSVTTVTADMTTDAVQKCGSPADISATLHSPGDHLLMPSAREPGINLTKSRLSLPIDSRLKTTSIDDVCLFPCSSAPATGIAPTTCNSRRETVHQSEVVKLLLQNRHQWVAAPQAKAQSPVGCRGSKKRNPSTNSRDSGLAKVPRHSRNGQAHLNEDPSRSLPSLGPKRFFSAPAVNNNQDEDHSSSLERLITELMLFESTTTDFQASLRDVDFKVTPTETKVEAILSDELGITPFISSYRPNDIFDGLIANKTSDAELFSSLELDSIYLNDCDPFSTLQETLSVDNAQNYEVFVKTEPDNSSFITSSSSSSSLCQLESFAHQNSWLNNEKADRTKNYNYSTSKDLKPYVLENMLQSTLLFNPAQCDSQLESKGFVSDHDYCQNLGILSLGSSLFDLAGEQQSRQERRRQYAEACLSRNRDYSALKSLLLDSNLTEEVRKEAEMDRARSRKKMSEKLKPTSVNDPLRLRRLGKVREDKGLIQQLELEDNCSLPEELLEKNSVKVENNDATIICDNENRANEDLGNENKSTKTDTSIAASCCSHEDTSQSFSPGTSRPQPATETGSNDSAMDDALVTSDLEISGNSDVIFFNSFEDFYRSNQDENLNLLGEDHNKTTVTKQKSDSVYLSNAKFSKKIYRVIKKFRDQSSISKNRGSRDLQLTSGHHSYRKSLRMFERLSRAKHDNSRLRCRQVRQHSKSSVKSTRRHLNVNAPKSCNG